MGGIEQGTKQTKNSSQFLRRQPSAHLGDRAKSRIILTGENKTEPESFNAFLQLSRRQIKRSPQRFQNIRTATPRGNTTVTVFDDDRSSGGQNKHDRCRNIKQINAVAPRAADVDHRASNILRIN